MACATGWCALRQLDGRGRFDDQLVSNSRMQPTDATDHRLTELEIKASFNEDLLDQLNQVIIRQQGQIDALLRQVAQLHQQMPEASGLTFSRPGDDLPPHY